MHGDSLRVATYNIHGAVGMDGRQDIGRIASVIEQIAPDVISLQEVETRPLQSSTNQAEYLSDRLGMICVEAPLLFEEGGWYGNAILSQWPVHRVRRWRFASSGDEPRGMLSVQINCGVGTVWHVLNTHLDRRACHRLRQAEALAGFLASEERTPTVLTGDLNEWRPWTKVMSALRRVGHVPATPRSFPSLCPLFSLDRIVLRECRLQMGPARHSTPLSRRASDHLPIVATLCSDPLRGRGEPRSDATSPHHEENAASAPATASALSPSLYGT